MTLSKKEQFKAALITALGYTHVKKFEDAIAQQNIYETWINASIDMLFNKNVSTLEAIKHLYDLRRQCYLQHVEL